MKLALLGYGKMGKEIEKVASERNHEIILISDSNAGFKHKELSKADAAIEFSIPAAAPDNILKCFAANIPVVCGTTGWNNRLEEITKICKTENKSLFYSPNFSIGMNIFFEVNNRLAQLMNSQKDYDVSIKEIHHIHKLDAPSGTAISIAENIFDRLERKKTWRSRRKNAQYSGDIPLQSDEIDILSVRENEAHGTHSVRYRSQTDRIEIKHEAMNRKGFALGAVMAAEWIKDKKGVLAMKDMLGSGY